MALTFIDAVTIRCDTHSVFETGKDETIVMWLIEFTEDRTKIKTWTISRGIFYRNTRTISRFVPFV